jgi:tetratricopeptide repeat protein 30
MGYCTYYSGDFEAATNTYQHLIELYPDNEDYKLYYAQALYKV